MRLCCQFTAGRARSELQVEGDAEKFEGFPHRLARVEQVEAFLACVEQDLALSTPLVQGHLAFVEVVHNLLCMYCAEIRTVRIQVVCKGRPGKRGAKMKHG